VGLVDDQEVEGGGGEEGGVLGFLDFGQGVEGEEHRCSGVADQPVGQVLPRVGGIGLGCGQHRMRGGTQRRDGDHRLAAEVGAGGGRPLGAQVQARHCHRQMPHSQLLGGAQCEEGFAGAAGGDDVAASVWAAQVTDRVGDALLLIGAQGQARGVLCVCGAGWGHAGPRRTAQAGQVAILARESNSVTWFPATWAACAMRWAHSPSR
jgi:hypothetical protein